MSSRRRNPPRLSDSPGRSIGDSLLADGFPEREPNLVGPLELQPVSGAFENLESIVSSHVFAGLLSLQTPQRWILISPKQRCGRVDLHVTAQARPPVVARQVGAVVDRKSTRLNSS